LTYDFRNRLVKAKNTTDGTEARYLYDYRNRRVKKHVEKVLDSPPDTQYNYSGWQVLEELEFDDIAEEWNLTRQYIYGTQYIDEILAAVNHPGEQNETIMYYMQDANYNVIGIVDEAGDVKERYNYAPYGDITITDAGYLTLSESPAGNTLTFQGRRLDTETGLYYYRNRYYSPELGRFIQRDPLGYVDGMNLYEFVGGRVPKGIDPYGLWKIMRDGKSTARACGMPGETIAQLAAAIGLCPSESRQWLTPAKGQNYAVTSPEGEWFDIPNTVIALWAGHFGVAGNAWVGWWMDIADAKGKGYKVDEYSHITSGTLLNHIETGTSQRTLHGFLFRGDSCESGLFVRTNVLSYMGGLVGILTPSVDDYLSYKLWKSSAKYMLGYGRIRSCWSDAAKYGDYPVFSPNSDFRGYEGLCIPILPLRADIDSAWITGPASAAASTCATGAGAAFNYVTDSTRWSAWETTYPDGERAGGIAFSIIRW